jgi:hypothetical protein
MIVGWPEGKPERVKIILCPALILMNGVGEELGKLETKRRWTVARDKESCRKISRDAEAKI